MKNILFNFVSLIIFLQTSIKFAASQEVDDCEILYDIFVKLNGQNHIFWDRNVPGSCCDDKIIVCDPHHNVKRIAELKLREKQFSGDLPNEITKLKYLNYFSVADNNIGGTIPENINDLIYLTKFSLRNNRITGNIPENIGKMDGIFHLDFSDNQLTGEIPKSFGDLSQLQFLALRSNKLEGYVPASFSKLKKLTTFELSGNAGLTGYVPLLDTISNCTYEGTNLCYKEGALCKSEAHQCTQEEIKLSEQNNGFGEVIEGSSANGGNNDSCNCGYSFGSKEFFRKNLLFILVGVAVIAILIIMGCCLFKGKPKEEDDKIKMKPGNGNYNAYYY